MVKKTLRTQQEIKQILKHGLKYKQKYIEFLWRKTSQPYRYAISCAKYIIPRAVNRNYIRRLNRVQANTAPLNGLKIGLLIRIRPQLASVAKNQLNEVITQTWKSFCKQSKVLYSKPSRDLKEI